MGGTIRRQPPRRRVDLAGRHRIVAPIMAKLRPAVQKALEPLRRADPAMARPIDAAGPYRLRREPISGVVRAEAAPNRLPGSSRNRRAGTPAQGRAPLAAWSPKLTTMQQPLAEIAEATARVMLNAMTQPGHATEQVWIRGSLLEGQSVLPINPQP